MVWHLTDGYPTVKLLFFFNARLGDTQENLKRVAPIIENYYYFGPSCLAGLETPQSHIQLNTDVHNPPPDISPSQIPLRRPGVPLALTTAAVTPH